MRLPSPKSKARRQDSIDKSQDRTRPRPASPQGIRAYDLIAFDGDDTLWDTQPLYEAAKDEFEDLCKKLGLWDTNVRNELDHIDAQRVVSHGFSRDRFPGSLVEVLEIRASRTRISLPPDAIHGARYIGQHVFDKPAPLRDAVPALLQTLAQRYRLILVTKGDRGVQLQRVRAHDLGRYFESVHIVRSKSAVVLRRIFRTKGIDPTRALVVGDSLRSDIHPALAVGASALWIPSKSWRFEHADLPESGRFSKAESLEELRKLL